MPDIVCPICRKKIAIAADYIIAHTQTVVVIDVEKAKRIVKEDMCVGSGLAVMKLANGYNLKS